MEIKEMIKNSDYFDLKFYVNNYPIPSGVDPLEHYLETGWKLCYDPSDKFSSAGYLYENNDVFNNNINPLVHYLLHGSRERRQFISTQDMILLSGIFNPYYYIHYHLGGDATYSERDAARHYAMKGWKETCDVDFSHLLSDYMENGDETTELCVPILHYLLHSPDRGFIAPREEENLELMAIKNSEYFDSAYYRKTYCLSGEMDLEGHYYKFGAKSFYDPSPFFSTAGYWARNQDVYAADSNPLAHYELCGRDEGREWIPSRELLNRNGNFDHGYYCARYLYKYIGEKDYKKWAEDDFLRRGAVQELIPAKSYESLPGGKIYAAFWRDQLADGKNEPIHE